MVKATLAMQQPVLESIEDLASKMDARIKDLRSDMDARIDDLASRMDARFEKMESNFADLRVDMAKRDAQMARRDTRIIVTAITLAIVIVGFLFQIQSKVAL